MALHASMRARTAFSMPHSARGRARITSTPAFLQRVRVASSASSGRMTASSMEIFSGTCAQSLKNARSLGRPLPPCVRVSNGISLNDTAGFSRRCSPSFSSASRRRPFKTEMGNAVFSSVSICTASHKYGVPPVFLNCCSQRSVLTGSFCAISHMQSSAVTTASFSPSETVTRGFSPAKALNVNVTGTRCASFLYKVCSCANTAEFALSTSSFVRVPNMVHPLCADR